ncbi:MAG: thiamine pyrophosphate-binding protein, partial [Pseudomonadota bacterium]
MDTRRGADILVEALLAQGVGTCFGVPGESYLAVLDALRDRDLRFVLARHESGAAFMAEAWGKLTGTPGVAFVTRGPGATNASIGVHTARQNSSPLILFVGQIETGMRTREAFQEIDYRAFFSPIAKWATEIDHPDRIGETVARAFHSALSGRPGPVVVALPEDVLSGMGRAAIHAQPIAPAWPGVAPGDVARAEALIAASERPVALIGGGGWDGTGREGRPALTAFTRFAERAGLPIVTAFRAQDLIDNHAPAFIGDAGFGMSAHVRATLDASNLILALGVRFGETATDGYTLFEIPSPAQTLIHVHASDGELGKIYQTPHAHHASPALFAAGLGESALAATPARSAWAAQARAAFEATLSPPTQPGTLDMGAVMAHLRAVLPADAIVTNGAGNFAVWPGRHILYGPGQRLIAAQAGAMGSGLPAAIAARLAEPARRVVCFCGDGDFQMCLAELGTAAQDGAAPIVLVIDNAS